MLRSMKGLLDYSIEAVDGQLGRVTDFYFHDGTWDIRYAVVDTGLFLPGRQVLLAPSGMSSPDWENQVIPVEYTRAQVKNSPSIAADLPVSRQQEEQLHDYFKWYPYWGFYGTATQPYAVPIERVPGEPYPDSEIEAERVGQGDKHLLSFRELRNYEIGAIDGGIGHVSDFIFDDETWKIQMMVVDTRKWISGRHVLLAVEWITAVAWEDRKVHVNLNKDTIKGSPEYDPADPVNEDIAQRLYDYYGRPAGVARR